MAYPLLAVSNRGVSSHHKRQKAASLLSCHIYKFLMALQVEIAQFLHLQQLSSYQVPQMLIYMCYMCSCAFSTNTGS